MKRRRKNRIIAVKYEATAKARAGEPLMTFVFLWHDRDAHSLDDLHDLIHSDTRFTAGLIVKRVRTIYTWDNFRKFMRWLDTDKIIRSRRIVWNDLSNLEYHRS